MKKLFILLAICTMLVGCSSNQNPTSDTDVEETTVNEITETEETSTSEEEKIFERGTVSDNVYTNTSIGINIEVPEGYVALSDEQLNSLVMNSAESKGIDNFQEAIESQAVTYDFGMIDPTGNGSVLVGIENLVIEGADGLVNNEEEYLTFATANLSANPNTEYSFSDIYDFPMTNDTWKAIDAIDDVNGINSTIIVKCHGDYVISIIYNYTNTSDPSIVLSYIY